MYGVVNHAVPVIIPNFTGRVEEVEEIRKQFIQGGQDCVVLSGEGGVGKTETALKYIQQHREQIHGNNVVWINASDQSNLLSAFQSFATNIDLSVGNRPADIVSGCYNFFAGNKENALFVFDNADDDTVNQIIMSDYLPAMGYQYIKILITSRSLVWNDWGHNVYPIDTFSIEVATAFIENELRDTNIDTELIPTLVEQLSCLPLALQQCTAYIRKNKVSIQRYLHLLEEDFAHLMCKELPRYGNSFLKVCQVTVDSLDEDSLSREILYIIAVLESSSIKKNLLTYLPNVSDTDVIEAISDISYRCLIKFEGDVLKMHSLTRTVLRRLLEEKSLARRYIQISVKLLEFAMGKEREHNRHYEFGDDWLQHIKIIVNECKEEHALLLIPLLEYTEKIVAALENKELFTDAYVLLSTFREKIEWNEQSKEFLQNIDIFILFTLMKLERYEDAKIHFRLMNPEITEDDLNISSTIIDIDSLCDEVEINLGTYKWETFRFYCEDNISWVTYDSHDFRSWYTTMYVNKNSAELKLLINLQLLEQMMHRGKHLHAYKTFDTMKDDFINYYGPEHRITLYIRGLIAECVYRKEQYDIAVIEFNNLHILCTKVLGPEHWLVYYTKRMYSLSLHYDGKHDEAKDELNDLYHQQLLTLGNRHRDTLTTENDLVMCWQKMMQLQKQRGGGDDSLAASQADEDTDFYDINLIDIDPHDEETMSIKLQCQMLFAREEYELARDQFQRFYKFQVRSLGKTHYDTLNIQDKYIKCLEISKQFDLAQKELQDLHDHQYREFGAYHTKTLSTKLRQCKLLCDKVDHASADNQIVKIYNSYSEAFGPYHDKSLKIKLQQCESLCNRGKGKLADEELNILYEGCKNVFGELHETTLSIKFHQCKNLFKQRMYKSARDELNKLRQLQIQHLGAIHDDTLQTQDWYMNCLRVLNQVILRENEMEHLYVLQTKLFGAFHTKTLETKFEKCQSLCERGEYNVGLDELEKLYESCENVYGEVHKKTLLIKFQQCKRLYEQQDYKSAAEELQHLLKVQGELLGETDYDYFESHRLYMQCLDKLNDFNTREQELERMYNIRKKAFGAYNRTTLNTKFQQCESLYKRGEYKSADDELKRIHEGCRNAFSEHHEKSLYIKFKQFEYLDKRGEHELVDDELLKLYDGCKSASGEFSEETLDIKFEQCAYLYKRGEYEVARTEVKKISDSFINTFGESHEQTFSIKIRLWNFYMNQYDFVSCCAELQQLLQLQVKHFGETHRDTLFTHRMYISFLQVINEHKILEKELDRMYNVYTKVHGAFHEQTLSTKFEYCESLYERGEHKLADDEMKILYDDHSREYGDVHVKTLAIKFQRCKYLYEQEYYESVRKELNSLRNIQDRHLGATHDDTFATHELYVKCLIEEKQFSMAENELHELYDLKCEVMGTFHSKTIDIFDLYYDLYREWKPQVLLDKLQKTYQKYIETLGENNNNIYYIPIENYSTFSR